MFHKAEWVLMLALVFCLTNRTLAGSPASDAAGPAGYSWFLADTDTDAGTEVPAAPVDAFLSHQAAGLWELTRERPSTPNTRSGQVRVWAVGSPFVRRKPEPEKRVLRWPRIAAGSKSSFRRLA